MLSEADPERTHVIRCGNHWLQSDDHRTDPKWVDLAHATLHTKAWCDEYAEVQLKLNTRVEVVPVGVALVGERLAGLEEVKKRWLYKFEDLVRNTFVGYTSDGLWVNAHMYYGLKLTVADAVEKFGLSLKLRKRSA